MSEGSTLTAYASNIPPRASSDFETLGYAAGYASYRWQRLRNGDLLQDEQRWTVIAAAAVAHIVAWGDDLHHLQNRLPSAANADSLAMAYALKVADQVVPLTGMIEPRC